MTTVDRAGGMSCTGAMSGVESADAGASAPWVPDAAAMSTSSVARVEAQLADLKEKLALDAQRETLTSNVSSAYHRIGMAIIGNCKA